MKSIFILGVYTEKRNKLAEDKLCAIGRLDGQSHLSYYDVTRPPGKKKA